MGLEPTFFIVPTDLVEATIRKYPTYRDRLDLLEEELAELIQVCGKIKRYGKEATHSRLIEEIADVVFTMSVVARMSDVTESDILARIFKQAQRYGIWEKGDNNG